jgi:hypothetical protein
MQAKGTLVHAERIPSFKDKNYTWCCGEIALRSAKVAIFGTSAGDKSQKRGDKSRQPFREAAVCGLSEGDRS